MSQHVIYLDNNATTKPTTSVVDSMLPYFRENYFNAATSTTAFTGVDKPRRAAAAAMAKLLNAEEPECFAFTSGATESNNWVLANVKHDKQRGRIVISSIEHASISEPAAALVCSGFEVVEVPVTPDGVIDPDAVSAMLTPDTVLVSIMAANNEIGTLQPLAAIGIAIRRAAPTAIFHTDATQAVGKIPVDVQEMWPEVDLLSFSAHKFHGPKGIGGLYMRPGIEVLPLLLGGGQENGLRSGTTNTPALAGLAAAASDAIDLAARSAITAMRDSFEAELLSTLPSVLVHATSMSRLPNTSCFSIPGTVGEDTAQTLAAKGILVGTGSACSSGSLRPPKTLLAMGIDYELASSAIRVSLSANTTRQELSALVRELVTICTH